MLRFNLLVTVWTPFCFCFFQIGEFYSKDPFGLELGLEFWCPTESLQHTSLQGSYLGMALQRPPHKQVWVVFSLSQQKSDCADTENICKMYFF